MAQGDDCVQKKIDLCSNCSLSAQLHSFCRHESLPEIRFISLVEVTCASPRDKRAGSKSMKH